MAQKIKTPLFPFLDLGGSWVVEWDAVDPTTGDTVPGVVISETSLLVAGDTGSGADQPILVPAPLLAHEPGTA